MLVRKLPVIIVSLFAIRISSTKAMTGTDSFLLGIDFVPL